MEPDEKIAGSMLISSFPVDITLVNIFTTPAFIHVCIVFLPIIDIWRDTYHDIISRKKTWLIAISGCFTSRIRFMWTLIPLNIKILNCMAKNNLPDWFHLLSQNHLHRYLVQGWFHYWKFVANYYSKINLIPSRF